MDEREPLKTITGTAPIFAIALYIISNFVSWPFSPSQLTNATNLALFGSIALGTSWLFNIIFFAVWDSIGGVYRNIGIHKKYAKDKDAGIYARAYLDYLQHTSFKAEIIDYLRRRHAAYFVRLQLFWAIMLCLCVVFIFGIEFMYEDHLMISILDFRNILVAATICIMVVFITAPILLSASRISKKIKLVQEIALIENKYLHSAYMLSDHDISTKIKHYEDTL